MGDVKGEDASVIEAVELRQEGVVEHGYHHIPIHGNAFQERT